MKNVEINRREPWGALTSHQHPNFLIMITGLLCAAGQTSPAGQIGQDGVLIADLEVSRGILR
jgi:hypothetical protein